MKAARVGEQTGAAEYAWVNRIFCFANSSRCGVSWRSAPYEPRSDQPRSSAMMNMIFGRDDFRSERISVAITDGTTISHPSKNKRRVI